MSEFRYRRSLLAAGLLLSSTLAHAQRPGRTFRIGNAWVAGAASIRSYEEAFLAGLRDHGFERGRNLVFDMRTCDGDASRLPAVVDELIALGPDLLAGIEQVAVVMRRKTSTIPIVLTNSTDPVAVGLATTLARPGSNVTGMSLLSEMIIAKQAELTKEFLPRMRTVALLLDPGVPGSSSIERSVQASAQSLGLKVDSYLVKDRAALEQAFTDFERIRPDAILGGGGSGLLFGYRQLIAERALKIRLPVAGGAEAAAEAGFLFTYGANLHQMMRRAAWHAARILQGANPAELPIEQPTTFQLVINLKTAAALGLAVPQSLLLRADRVID